MSALGSATEPGEGGPAPSEAILAGLWSSALASLVGRAAHEINNALNGAMMNVAVVKARARPGADAGAVADFADAAGEQLEQTATLVEALVALARGPGATVDVSRTLRHTVTLLAPAVARDGITIEVADARAGATGGDPLATRLAVVASLLAVVDAVVEGVRAAGLMVESGGADRAADNGDARGPSRVVRCTILPGERLGVEFTTADGVVIAPAVRRVLATAGIDVFADSDVLRLALPAPAAS